MPLNDHEKQILEEIERQFYEQDPELARAVATRKPRSEGTWPARLATVGLFVGLAVMLVSFSRSTLIGLLGFLTMVGSAGFLVERFAARYRLLDTRLATRVERAKQRMRRER